MILHSSTITNSRICALMKYEINQWIVSNAYKLSIMENVDNLMLIF